MNWFANYVSVSKKTDNFSGNPSHALLLASGLFGEAGSIIAELKKMQREEKSYPKRQLRIKEEIGDFLWYFIQLVSILDSSLIDRMDKSLEAPIAKTGEDRLSNFLYLGNSVGALMGLVKSHTLPEGSQCIISIWESLRRISEEVDVVLSEAAEDNLKKIASRWPTEKNYHGLFDEDEIEVERLPRYMEIEFLQLRRSDKDVVILRCNHLNFGDPLSDNVHNPDGYRFHDVFHFSYMVFLGWSPVIRALLKCKRKGSKLNLDEAQDGARAIVVEEAVSAAVFSRIKLLDSFDEMEHVDFDLLKMISEFVKDYEVAQIPFWQWDEAIMNGYDLFRKLCKHNGGTIVADMQKRQLIYSPPAP